MDLKKGDVLGETGPVTVSEQSNSREQGHEVLLTCNRFLETGKMGTSR